MTVQENDIAEREIVTTRLIRAPRELVFDAFVDREQVGNWWGPRGFTTTTSEMEVRPGGTWRFIMHGPDGTDYPNTIVYLRIQRPSLLAYTHGGDEPSENDFQTVVTFEEEGEGTRLTMRAIFSSPAARDYVAKYHHAVEGGKQTVDRLEEFLVGRV